MRAVQLPPWRIALRHPAVRAALLLLVLAPMWVGLLGEPADAGARLRVLGFVLAACAALSWDDRGHAVAASTPVGLPAVRRGRIAVVVCVLVGAFLLGQLALPSDVHVSAPASALQSLAVGALLLAVVAWFGRDGDPVLVVPLPALLLSLAVLVKLPRAVGFLHEEPGSPGWPAERARWVAMCVLGLGVAAWLGRDAASRRGAGT